MADSVSTADISITNSTARIVDVAGSEDSRSGSCRLSCLQNIKVYTCALSILAFLNGAIAAAYLPSVITTIEEVFQLDSAMSGLIVSSYEIGATIAVVLVSYLGHHGHIPLIIGWGTFVIAIGSALFSLPHFINDSTHSEKLLASGVHDNQSNSINSTDFCNPNLSEEYIDEMCIPDKYSGNKLAIAIFIIAQTLIGIGSSPILTIGLSYIDNYVNKKTTSAQYISYAYAASIVGAVLGFGVGSAMLELYVDTFAGFTAAKLGITSKDKDLWIGAWWGGFLLFAVLMCIIAPWLCMFPKSMDTIKSNAGSMEDLDDDRVVNASAGLTSGKLSELPKSLLLLISNPVYMFINMGSVCEMLIVTGYLTFAAKYLETQFYVSKSSASLITGGVAVPAATLGIVIMGFVMKKYKLGEMGAIKMILILNIVGIGGFGASFFLGCSNMKIAGVTTPYNSNDGMTLQTVNLTDSCNQNCNCDTNIYTPICHKDSGVTYASHCLAGCSYDGTNEAHQCSCVSAYMPNNTHEFYLDTESCETVCSIMPLYLVVLSIVSFAMAGTKTPITVITLRRVNDELKSFGLGIQVMIIRLLALLPAPIVYGAVIDSSCIWWKMDCGQQRNCFVYGNDDFIFRFQGISMAFQLTGTLMFFFAWLIMRRNRHPEEMTKVDHNAAEETTVTRL